MKNYLLIMAVCLFNVSLVTGASHLLPEPVPGRTRLHLEGELATSSNGGWTPFSIGESNTVFTAATKAATKDVNNWLQWENLKLVLDEYYDAQYEYSVFLSWAHNRPSSWIIGEIYAGPNARDLRLVKNYQAVTFVDDSKLQWSQISTAIPLLATDTVIRVTFNSDLPVSRQYIDSIMLVPYTIPAHVVVSEKRPDGIVNPLTPKGKPGPELTLASSGKTDYVILLPSEPTTQEKKAGSELALHLQLITGVPFSQITEGSEKLSDSTKIMSVGDTQLLKNTRLEQKAVDLGGEGYAIAVKGDNIFLFGGKVRGPLFAIIAMLEEDLGMRWFTPNYTSVIKIPNLKFRPVQRTYVPQFELRQPAIHEANGEIWSLRNHVNIIANLRMIRDEWGGSYPMAKNLYFVHTFQELMPQAKYFTEHPEYYSMHDGKRDTLQLCASNPDVSKIITEEILSRVINGREIFSVSANDGGGYCQCPKCKEINDAESSGSAAILRMVNNVATCVTQKYPNVRIMHLAYTQGTDIAPRTLSPHKNVIVHLATNTDAWSFPLIPYTQTKATRELVNGWNDRGANLIIWDYVTNFSYALLPFPNMAVVAENIRFFAEKENKVVGIFLEGNMNVGSDRASLRSWVWSKLLWDPTLNSQDLIREFNYGYYGSAAEPIQKYDELLEQVYNKNFPRFKAEYEIGLGSFYQIRFGPDVAFLRSGPYLEEASKLFENAEKLATESTDKDLLRRVKLAKLPLLYTKLTRGPGSRYLKSYHFYESKEKYSEMINEFESITKNENITMPLEQREDDTTVLIKEWRKLLTLAEDEK